MNGASHLPVKTKVKYDLHTLYVYLSLFYLSIYLSVCLSIYLSMSSSDDIIPVINAISSKIVTEMIVIGRMRIASV